MEQAAQNPAAFAQEAARNEEPQKELLAAVRRTRNKLEAEYESTLAAKTLFSAQREECPPGYRRMVNQYFEALSKGATSAK
jgi:hypothetical protein